MEKVQSGAATIVVIGAVGFGLAFFEKSQALDQMRLSFESKGFSAIQAECMRSHVDSATPLVWFLPLVGEMIAGSDVEAKSSQIGFDAARNCL